LRTSILVVASSLVLAGAPQVAQAAGLGRLVVLSALGQPLRAEIEVTATRQELLDMKAQLASPETFKQAGLDYAAGLMSVRFNLDKRPDGQPIIKLTSDRPINDPFIDMLLELSWSSGRLVREYTFLLNPQEYVARRPELTASAPAVSAPTVASRPIPPPVTVNIRGAQAIDNDVRARAVAQVQGTPQQAAQKPANAAATQSGEGREVKRGETLHRIATEMKPEADGVSLDQMLVGLFRANPNAFDGSNMNRLRTGAILSKPEKSALESVSTEEAKRIIRAQSSDWNTYQSKLAGVAAKSQGRDDAARQGSSGKITAKVDDRAERASPKDQLIVSRADSASRKGGAAGARVSDEDLIAKDRALKEASERVAALEKNVTDLRNLLELKNKQLESWQKQAAAASAQPAPAPTPVAQTPALTTATPVSAPAKVEPPPTPPPPPAPAAKPAQPPAPAAATPRPTPRPKPVMPPPPPPEPELFDDPIGYLLNNLMVLAAVVGGIVAIIAAYFFMRRRRAMAEASEQSLSSTLTSSGTTTSLMDSSVFHNTGGQSVDTSSTSRGPLQTDFSQAGPGSIDTDEVDPVAEADVYMAYGRDAQAEEILLEARQKDPKRIAITVKLLEIYSGRKDAKQFESLATDLYSETGGVGADWEKVAAMGRSLDPNNPIFHGTASTAGAVKARSAPSVAAAAAAKAAPATLAPLMDTDYTGDVKRKGEPVPTPQTSIPSNSASLQPETLSSNRGGNASPNGVPSVGSAKPASGAKSADASLPEKPKPAAQGATGAKASDVADIDFDIGTRIAPVAEVLDQQEAKTQLPDLDFDLGGDSLLPAEYEKTEKTAVDETDAHADEQVLGDDAVEFDVSLTESTFLGRMPSEPSSFDMASIDLGLHSPDLDIAGFDENQPPSANAAKAFQGLDEDQTLNRETQVSTAINPDFAREQMETVVTPPSSQNDDVTSELIETQTMSEIPGSQSDTVFNFDLANQQAETVDEPSMDPGTDAGSGGEVATKLDLANAYEEMGDIEGARELLQEVLKEGYVSQREAAQNMLARIGG
jgi:pilus assembly protein FimV